MAMPTGPKGNERVLARQGRLVALLVAATMLMWMGAQWVGRELGWEARFAILFDLAALAAFVWALFVTYRIWRKRRDSQE